MSYANSGYLRTQPGHPPPARHCSSPAALPARDASAAIVARQSAEFAAVRHSADRNNRRWRRGLSLRRRLWRAYHGGVHCGAGRMSCGRARVTVRSAPPSLTSRLLWDGSGTVPTSGPEFRHLLIRRYQLNALEMQGQIA